MFRDVPGCSVFLVLSTARVQRVFFLLAGSRSRLRRSQSQLRYEKIPSGTQGKIGLRKSQILVLNRVRDFKSRPHIPSLNFSESISPPPPLAIEEDTGPFLSPVWCTIHLASTSIVLKLHAVNQGRSQDFSVGTHSFPSHLFTPPPPPKKKDQSHFRFTCLLFQIACARVLIEYRLTYFSVFFFFE